MRVGLRHGKMCCLWQGKALSGVNNATLTTSTQKLVLFDVTGLIHGVRVAVDTLGMGDIPKDLILLAKEK